MIKTTTDLPKGIRPHKSGGYIVDLTRNGKRTTIVCKTPEEAIARRLALMEAAKATPKVRAGWTLLDAYNRTHTLCWQGTGGEQAATINARTAMTFFGPDTPVKAITQERVGDYLVHLMQSGLSGSTINRKLSALSRCLRTALEHGKLDFLPKMPKRREGEHRIRFLSGEEEERLLEAIEALGYGQELSDVVLCLLYTGFRLGELWRLEVRDVDMVNNTLTTWKTKSHRARTIAITDKIKPVIARRCKEVKEGRLFPYDNMWIRTRWDRVREFMGLSDDEQFVPHMLRHTCATRLARGGTSLRVVKEWMGHASIQTTMRYAHFAPSDLASAAKTLSA